MNMKFEIWSKDFCNFCTKAKTLLNIKKIDYNEYIITENDLSENQTRVTIDDLKSNFPNARSVPQINLINDDGSKQYIGGFTDLEKFFLNQKS